MMGLRPSREEGQTPELPLSAMRGHSEKAANESQEEVSGQKPNLLAP